LLNLFLSSDSAAVCKSMLKTFLFSLTRCLAPARLKLRPYGTIGLHVCLFIISVISIVVVRSAAGMTRAAVHYSQLFPKILFWEPGLTTVTLAQKLTIVLCRPNYFNNYYTNQNDLW